MCTIRSIPNFFHLGIAKTDHFLELPGGVYVHEWKRQFTWVERLASQMQHHRRVLPNGVQHDRVVEFRSNFPDDMDASASSCLRWVKS